MKAVSNEVKSRKTFTSHKLTKKPLKTSIAQERAVRNIA